MSFTSLPLMEINHKLPAQNIIESHWVTLQLTLFAQEQQANKVSQAVVNAAYRKAEKIIRDAYRYQREQKWSYSRKYRGCVKIRWKNGGGVVRTICKTSTRR